MITAVVMPQMGLEVTEGTVSAILVEVGASVAAEDALLELETDKATTDVVAPRAGVVREIVVSVGDTVPVGATLARLADRADERLDGDGDGAAQPTVGAGAGQAATDRSDGPGAGAAAAVAVAPVVATAASGRLRVAPVARRAAANLGIALEALSGTGPRGRITLRDVERAAAAARGENGVREVEHAAAAAHGENGGREVERAAVGAHGENGARDVVVEQPTALRRAIARRMTQSQAIPQYQLVRDVDATHLLAQRTALVAGAPAGAPRASVNDLLVQALGETVVRHPLLATSWVEPDGQPARLERRTRIDVGLAVATDRGLVVPVLRDVPHRGVGELARQRGELIAAASAGRLSLEQMGGGAITLSNLAGFGIDRFGAMVNPGEAAIVAAGRVVDRLVPRDRTIAIVPTLTLTLSFDHRVVDGAAGAEALATLAELLEGGMTWRP